MIKSAKKVINSKVFDAETGEEIGIISDIGLKSGKIDGFRIKSNSIVPLDLWFCPTAVKNRGKKIIAERSLSKTAPPQSFKQNILNRSVFEKQTNSGSNHRENVSDEISAKIGRGKDLWWDSNTYEATAVSYRKNFLCKEKQVSANKTTISGETITIQI